MRRASRRRVAGVGLMILLFASAADASLLLQQEAGRLLQQGVGLLEAGRASEAVEPLERAVALVPDDPTARYQLGRALFSAGRPAAAVEHLEIAARSAADPGPVYFLLGQVLLETDALAAADEALRAADATRPGYPPIGYYQAELCYRLGRVDSARSRFAALAEGAPDWTAPVVRSGTLALEGGKPAEAVFWFERFTELAAGDPDAWMRLGTARVQNEQPYEALAAYRQAAVVAPDALGPAVAVAGQLLNLDEHDAALVAVDEVLAKEPSHGVMRYHRSRLVARTGKSDDALAEIEAALADLRGSAAGQVVDDEGVRLIDRASLWRAELLIDVGRDDEAVRLARDLVAADPAFPEPLFVLGNALLRAGDSGGRQYLETFRVLSDAREHRQLGDQFRLRDPDPQRAAEAYRRALEASPDDSRSWLGLGAVLRQTADAEGAIEALRRARSTGSADEEWHREWVLALLAAGRRDEASQAWKTARADGWSLGPAVWRLLRDPVGGC